LILRKIITNNAEFIARKFDFFKHNFSDLKVWTNEKAGKVANDRYWSGIVVKDFFLLWSSI
jgi:hypothetical protein